MNELQRAELRDTHLGEDVAALLRIFAAQTHNDPSAVIATFTRLAAGYPLSHLTGEDDEWFEVLPGLEQNRRCATVYRDKASGEAYDNEAVVFENPITGARHVSERSRHPITFPYYPRPRIVQMAPPGAEQQLPVIPSEEQPE